MRYKIDQLIRTHKTIIIGIITALLIIAFTVQNSYSVGSCQKQASISFIDESGGRNYQFRAIATSQNSSFKTYVTNISQHVFAKIDEIAQCKGNLKNDPQIKLVFVYRPLYVNKQYRTAPFDFQQTPSHNTSYLDSPWIKLALTRSPQLTVSVVFVWNERQFLLDQALMSGARPSPNVPLLPLDSRIYYKFLGDYLEVDSAIMSSSSEVRTAAFADLSKRVPIDILWLFRNSGNFDGHITAEFDMEKAIEQRLEQYTNLTKELLNHRFRFLQTEQRYNSVIDLKDVFNIDKYRLERIRLY